MYKVLIHVSDSDVTIIKIDIEIAVVFRKIKRNRYRDLWSKCNSIPTPYHPRWTGDQCRKSQSGFYTTTRQVQSRRV